jgi:cytochrome c-type biogenesis protein CcmF
MIAEAGLAALWLAAALSLLQVGLGWAAVWPGNETLLRIVRPLAVAQGVLVALSFGLLIWLFLTTDLSVKLVATNSHSEKPWLYKFAGAWGNHEGSMLLWVTVLGIAGAAVAGFERKLRQDTHVATLAAQATIALGFYAFLIFASNPFERGPVPETGDGAGLNPLLQDPGLAFHPPTLYFGYVGISVAFSFAVGALITRDVGRDFARAMRPWILGAWVLLTIGIAAGSYWAYYELGWGGWWFWDPVENASLMPWLAATALLHSVTVLATRDALRAWTVMLAVVAFSMSMIGTFLVRSGILTSVHSFAVDPERGYFILVLLGLYIGGALALFAARVGTVKEGSSFRVVSREGSLVLNNLLLTIILCLVLFGTLYPLVTEAMGHKISVGAPYFNLVAGPFALVLVIAMGAGPLLKWRKDDGKGLMRRMALPLLAGAATALTVVVTAPGTGLLPLLGLSVAVGVGIASLLPLVGRNLRRTPLITWGMVLSHLGIAVSLFGMASESAFTKEVLVAARAGETAEVGPFTVRFEGVEPTAGQNWTAIAGRLVARRGEGEEFVLLPEARMFSDPVTATSEAAIETRWDGQLYTVIGEPDGNRWQLRLWWKPWVTFIWFGGGLVALGGFMALAGRLRRSRRERKAGAAAADETAGDPPIGEPLPGREALA